MAAVPLARSSVVITTVNFFTDNGEVALRGIKRIGLPRKADGWDLNYRLHLACRMGAPEPEMFGGVFVLRRFAGRFPNHLESHSRGSGYRVQCRPARLIDHRNVLNLKREGVAVGTDTQTTLGNRNDPVKPRRRNGRVKVVYLVSGDSLSPEQRESYVSKDSLLCCPGGPVLPQHDAIIGCRTAKRDSISLVIGAHASKGAAPGYPSFEIVNV